MALGISTAQLTKMRSQVEELLPDTCVIHGAVNGIDSSGYPTQTYGAVTGGTVNCRIDPLGNKTAQLALYAEREAIKVLLQLTVPYDAPLLSDYRIVVGSNTYEIVQLDTQHSWNVSKRAIVSEIE